MKTLRLLELSKHILDNDSSKAITLIDTLIKGEAHRPTASSHQSWYTKLNEFKTFYTDHLEGRINESYKLPFSIFKKGNGKLPFINYSTIPVVNCPGADKCKAYCYSLNSMRFPRAVVSWLQNQVLENHYFDLIAINFDNFVQSIPKLRKSNNIDFRLYNDGDFSSIDIMKKWFTFLKNRPNIKCYGYTKSLNHISSLQLTGYNFPDNYKFNVSLGGKYDSLGDTSLITGCSSYRGKFISHNLENKKVKATTITKHQIKTLRKGYDKKIFICPGVCGDCTKIGHACGSDVFKDIDIVIPIH
tara:strand:+ start:154 stop:1056 length:903 start_codon:yes stop_codon:yes gene_type:complete